MQEAEESGMAARWNDRVRKRGTLLVYPHDSISSSSLWKDVYGKAISTFNTLSGSHSLGVTLSTATTAPTGNDKGGTDIMVSAASGKIPKGIPGVSKKTQSFDGQGLHGHTTVAKMVYGADPVIFNCFVFLPTDPQVGGPDSKRQIGQPVALCILVHEFIHCCGLSNADHVVGKTGIFCYPGEVLEGRTAREDRFKAWGTTGTPMPPITINDDTVKLIRPLWSSPSPPAHKPRPKKTGRNNRSTIGLDHRLAIDGVTNNMENRRASWRKPGPHGTDV